MAHAMDNGWTAHMWASMEGHLAVARLLLQHGADVAQATNNGTTALALAEEYQHRAVQLLLIAG